MPEFFGISGYGLGGISGYGLGGISNYGLGYGLGGYSTGLGTKVLGSGLSESNIIINYVIRVMSYYSTVYNIFYYFSDVCFLRHILNQYLIQILFNFVNRNKSYTKWLRAKCDINFVTEHLYVNQ